MKTLLTVTLSLFFASLNAFAIEDDDSSTHLPAGTQFIAQTDILILANNVVVSLESPEKDFGVCTLYFKSSDKERVLKSGMHLSVTSVEQDSFHWGSSIKVFFAVPQIYYFDCHRKKDDYIEVPTFGELKKILQGHFEIQVPTPETLPEKQVN